MVRFFFVAAICLAFSAIVAAHRNSQKKGKKKRLMACDGQTCPVRSPSFMELADASVRLKSLRNEHVKELFSDGVKKECGVCESIAVENLFISRDMQADKFKTMCDGVASIDVMFEKKLDWMWDEQKKTQILITEAQEDISKYKMTLKKIEQGDYLDFIEKVMGNEKGCWSTRKGEETGARMPITKGDEINSLIDQKIQELGGEANIIFESQVFLDAFKQWGGQENTACEQLRTHVADFINRKGQTSHFLHLQELDNRVQELCETLVELDRQSENCRTKKRELNYFQDQVWTLLEDIDEKQIESATKKREVKRLNKLFTAMNETFHNQTRYFADLQALLKQRGVETEEFQQLFNRQKAKLKDTDQKTQVAKAAFDESTDAVARSSNALRVANKLKEKLDEFLLLAVKAHEQVLSDPLENALGLTVRDLEEYQKMPVYFESVDSSGEHAAVLESLQGLQTTCTAHGEDLNIENVEKCGKTPSDFCSEQFLQPDSMETVVAGLKEAQIQVREDLTLLLETVGVQTQEDEPVPGDDEERQEWQEPKESLKFERYYQQSNFYTNYLEGWMVHRPEGKERIQGRLLLKLWWYLSNKDQELGNQRQKVTDVYNFLEVELSVYKEEGKAMELQLDRATKRLSLTREEALEAKNKLDDIAAKLEALGSQIEVAKEASEKLNNEFAAKNKELATKKAEVRGALLQLGFSAEDLEKKLFEETAEDWEFARLLESVGSLQQDRNAYRFQRGEKGSSMRTARKALHWTNSARSSIRAHVMQTP